MANRQIHCTCGFIYCVSQEITKSITDQYVVTKCPNCCTWANECLHCSACFMNSRYKNDLRSIKYHVKREHPKTLPYQGGRVMMLTLILMMMMMITMNPMMVLMISRSKLLNPMITLITVLTKWKRLLILILLTYSAIKNPMHISGKNTSAT